MVKKFYTIGEVAKIMNMPAKALRNYDSIDLLKPSYIDPDTKYRYYTYNQFFMIDVIKYLNKVLFIPLDEIKKIFASAKDDTTLHQIFVSHQEYLKSQIQKQQYALQLVNNLVDDDKFIHQDQILAPRYESYYLDRTLYYHPFDVPIEEVDAYVNRSDLSFIQHGNLESDNMCLLFSLSDYHQKKKLYIKGFGIFSDKKIPYLQSKNIKEGRYINQRFTYSEAGCEEVLSELLNYSAKHQYSLDDTFILVSKTVDFHSVSKYEYPMTLQLRYLHLS